MNLLVCDFPGDTSQQYDQLCRSLNPLRPKIGVAYGPVRRTS
jgi:hypothetical protein